MAKLLRTRLDGDELFKRCKDLQVEIKNLGDKLENMVAERDKLAKVVVDLDARLKESKSRLEESKLQATKEREASKELEEELLVYKKEVMEQHGKRFQKAVRQADFFAKDLYLGLFDPFKDVKDDVLLDEEDIVVEEEVADEGQGVGEQGDDTCV